MKIHQLKDFWKNNLKNATGGWRRRKKAEKSFSRYVALLFVCYCFRSEL